MENTTTLLKTDFRLVGLSTDRMFTCELLYTDKEIFWVKSHLPEDRYLALFKWAKSEDGFWKTKWIVEIEHEGLDKDGLPKNPKAIEIREWDL